MNDVTDPCWCNQSQRQLLPRSSLPVADLTAEMETMAQRRGSMDDSFHRPNLSHMAWVDPLRARFESIVASSE